MSTSYINFSWGHQPRHCWCRRLVKARWGRNQSNFSHYFAWRPADGCPCSIPYDCPKLLYRRRWSCRNRVHAFLFPRYTDTRLTQTTLLKRGYSDVVCSRLQAERNLARPKRPGSHFHHPPAHSTRVTPAGGSLYLSKDLDKIVTGLGVPLDDKHFCIGPDTRLPLRYGRRAKLEVDQGPCRSFSVFSWPYPETGQ